MANGLIFKELLQTANFRITVVEESDTVELCGALKVGKRVSQVSTQSSFLLKIINDYTLLRTSWQ